MKRVSDTIMAIMLVFEGNVGADLWALTCREG